MSRCIVLAAAAAAVVAADATPSAVALPMHATGALERPVSGLLVPNAPVYAALPTLAVARIFAAFAPMATSPVPPEIIDRLVRTELMARDAFQNALDGLLRFTEALAADAPTPPDLTILTTSPIAAMDTSESSGFGWRDDPYHHDVRYHSGADFRAKPGTPVLAAGDGVVVFAQWQGGYGNVVYVDHGGGVVTRYAHMRRIVATKDTVIVAGQQLGEVGQTGRATGPHLHFEVRIDGHAVSPVLAMSVARLQRDDPAAGRVAALALDPALQERALADVDRPHHAPPPPANAGTTTPPERPGFVHAVKPLW
jgi:murein DD-endopeptidase MepM/ murein hydrolase activator NlpD